jgi:hypothetical protein
MPRKGRKAELIGGVRATIRSGKEVRLCGG